MPANNDTYHLIKTFCTVVQQASFSKAAVRLGLPASSVSKNVKQLEQQLKTPLIIRNTRTMSLTDAGTLCYEKGGKLLLQMNELEQEMLSLNDTPTGVLRISMPLMIGERILAPAIAKFLAQFPDINLELDFSHHPQDLIEQDYDVVFRTTKRLPNSELFEVKLLDLNSIWVASPDYLKHSGTPEELQDLKHHKILEFHSSVNARSLSNGIDCGELNRTRILSNSYSSLITAAVAGQGLVHLYDVLVQDELNNQKLKKVLQHHSEEPKSLSMIYRQRGQTSKKIQSFRDFVQQYFALRK